MRILHDTAAASSLWRQRERLGDLEAYEEPRKTDSAEWEVDTAAATAGTNALLDALGETNPILKDLLKNAKDEINQAAIISHNNGRRLMQRKEYNVRMTDALITAEIMTFYGSGGIPGVTSGSVIGIEHTHTLVLRWRIVCVCAVRSALRGHGTSARRAPHRSMQGLCLQARGAL